MTSVIPREVLAQTFLTEHCRKCQGGMVMVDGQLVVCGRCGGSTRVKRGMFDPASGTDFEPGATPEKLHAEQYEVAEIHTDNPAVLVPTRLLLRALELARVVRDPTNSAQVAELLDVVEEMANG